MKLLSLVLIFVTTAFSAHATNEMVFMRETADGIKRIYWMPGEANSAKELPTKYDFNIYPSISRDASEMAFITGTGPEDLFVAIYNLETGKEKRITNNAGFVLHPHLSASKRYLAYSEFIPSTNKNRITILDRPTKKLITIGAEDGSLFFPKLSSNASFVVYQKSINDNTKEIWLDYLDNRESLRLAKKDTKCMAPAINFEDTKVAFTCFINERWNLFLQDLKTLEITQLTFTDEDSYAPSFDSEGNITFASNPKGKDYALYKLDKIPNTNQYGPASLVIEMEGSLYAPSISGDINYRQNFSNKLPNPARSSFGAIHLDGKNYVIGGHKGAEHTYPPESFSDRVDIYNIENQKWSEGSPRPVKAHGFDVETCNGKIYAFGGFAYSSEHKPKWKSLSRVDRYDPTTNTWEKVADMPRRRSSNVAVKVRGKIYLMGGWDSTPKHDNDYEGHFHREVDVFDCQTENFIETDLEIPDPLRRAFTAVEKDDKIYLVGGLGVGATHFELLDAVTVFDPLTQSFKEEAPLPFGTFAPAVGIIKDKLHVFGGMFKTGKMSYEYVNHIYRMDSNGWNHTGRYLSESKGFSMVLNVASEAWVLGGHSYDGNTDEPVNTVEVWSSL